VSKPEVDQPESGPQGRRLRYPGHDTPECASQLRALSRTVKQAYGVEAGAVRMTSRDNMGEAHMTERGESLAEEER